MKRRWSLNLVVLLAFTVAWLVVTNAGWVHSLFLPTPQSVLRAYRTLHENGFLLSSIAATLQRVLLGYAIGTTAGVAIGLFMGWFRTVYDVLNPPFQFVRAIPPLAFISLYILWFGIGEEPKVIMIAAGCAIATIINTIAGVRNVPRIYLEAARTLGARPRHLFLRIVLPAALPYVLTGYRVALTMAWGLVVASELIAAQRGLGYLLLQAREYLQTNVIFASIFVIGLLALVMDDLLMRLENHLTRWMERR
jgi:ABC-type nitrate/sulfonate/bicarbonate transport system permease component